MYIGSTDHRGLHHLIWELLDNSVDEAMSGYANKIWVSMNIDGSITVEDNGTGIPVGTKSTTKKSTVDTVFTGLRAGGKCSDDADSFAGGLRGVGSSVVNALSIWLNAEVYVNGNAYRSEYDSRGSMKSSLTKGETPKKKGQK